jgi:hypothetical protein
MAKKHDGRGETWALRERSKAKTQILQHGFTISDDAGRSASVHERLARIVEGKLSTAILSGWSPSGSPTRVVDDIGIPETTRCGPAFASWLRLRKRRPLSNKTSNPVKDVPEADSARQKAEILL